MHLTVALCTRNRSAQLRATLDRFTCLLIPPETTWEVVVIDNASSDETRTVIQTFASRLPLRSRTEPRPGVAFARNRAIDAAQGEYILWTDDDVLVSPGWLAAYASAFRRWPHAAVFGGPITPAFVGTPAPWLFQVLDRIGPAYAQRKLASTPTPIGGEHDVPFGANMAVRTAEQRTSRFDTRLAVCEETDCLRAILRAGAIGWWVPEAPVVHVIPAHRQTIRYVRSYYAGVGRVYARTRTDRRLRRPRWIWRELLSAEIRYRLRRLWCPPESWIEDLIAASYAWGAFQGFGEPTLDLTNPVSG